MHRLAPHLLYCLTALLIAAAWLGLEYGIVPLGYVDPNVCAETAPATR